MIFPGVKDQHRPSFSPRKIEMVCVGSGFAFAYLTNYAANPVKMLNKAHCVCLAFQERHLLIKESIYEPFCAVQAHLCAVFACDTEERDTECNWKNEDVAEAQGDSVYGNESREILVTSPSRWDNYWHSKIEESVRAKANSVKKMMISRDLIKSLESALSSGEMNIKTWTLLRLSWCETSMQEETHQRLLCLQC